MKADVRKYLAKIGRKGGQTMTPVKRAALLLNLKAAHKAKRKYPPCPRYKNRSHRFSPKTGRCACGYIKPER